MPLDKPQLIHVEDRAGEERLRDGRLLAERDAAVGAMIGIFAWAFHLNPEFSLLNASAVAKFYSLTFHQISDRPIVSVGFCKTAARGRILSWKISFR